MISIFLVYSSFTNVDTNYAIRCKTLSLLWGFIESKRHHYEVTNLIKHIAKVWGFKRSVIQSLWKQKHFVDWSSLVYAA